MALVSDMATGSLDIAWATLLGSSLLLRGKVVDEAGVLLHALDGASHLQCLDVNVKTRD